MSRHEIDSGACRLSYSIGWETVLGNAGGNANRAAMGLPPFDPMPIQPQNLDEYELMMGRG
jgi:hypothetical protein